MYHHTQYNDIQHTDLVCDTEHNNALHYAECQYVQCRILHIVVLNVIIPSVTMLSVVAPLKSQTPTSEL
jgi:hypothetical protein